MVATYALRLSFRGVRRTLRSIWSSSLSLLANPASKKALFARISSHGGLWPPATRVRLDGRPRKGVAQIAFRPRRSGGFGLGLRGRLCLRRAAVRLDRRHLTGRSRRLYAQRLVDLPLELLRGRGVLAQVRLDVSAALADPLVPVGQERPRLGDDVVRERRVEDAALGRYALAVLDVELGLAERGRDLVLDDLDADAVADGLDAVLQRLDPADVEPLGRVELERAAAGLGLRRSEHHADLLPDLVRERAARVRAVEVSGQLAHRLAHHPRLQADRLIAHGHLEHGLRRERRHRVDRHDVDGTRADQ